MRARVSALYAVSLSSTVRAVCFHSANHSHQRGGERRIVATDLHGLRCVGPIVASRFGKMNCNGRHSPEQQQTSSKEIVEALDPVGKLLLPASATAPTPIN